MPCGSACTCGRCRTSTGRSSGEGRWSSWPSPSGYVPPGALPSPVMTPTAVVDDARRQQEGVVELRRRLHARPETGLQLPVTQTAVLEALDALPLRVTTGTTTTSIVAEL